MFQSNLPLHLWGHYVLVVVYLINRIPTLALSHQTPFEILFGHVPSYSQLKVFGCLYFASTLSNNKTKFAPRAKKCVFLGYSFGVKGYKVLDLSTHNVFISRDVIFHKDSFPFTTVSTNVADHFAYFEVDVAPSSSVGNGAFVIPIIIPEVANSPTVSIDSLPTPVSLAPLVPLRKSIRDTRPPTYLKDYACTAVAPGAPYDLAQSLNYSYLEPCYQSYLLAVNSCPQEPQHFYQAIQDPLWRVAMDKEIQALRVTTLGISLLYLLVNHLLGASGCIK